MINDLVISQIRQRLEILYQMVDELETGGGGGGGGTTNYNELSNKPAIEGTQLVGNKTASDLGLATTSQLNGKVDKVEGSSLMTSAQATKLEGIEAGAEVNVQADWNQANSSADDYIKNKPTLGAAAERGVDTVPTDDSTNLITSGAVYDAIQGGGGGGTDLTLRLISVSSNNVINQDDFNNVIAKHLPYKKSETDVGNYFLYETSSAYIYITYNPWSISDSDGTYTYSFKSISKTNRNITNVSTGGGHGYESVNSRNLLDTFFEGYYNGDGAVRNFPSDLNNASHFGIYRKTSTGAVTNCPTQELAYMEYNGFLGTNQQIQKIYTIGTTPTIYIRTKTGGTWSSWYKFEGTVVS